MSVGFRKSLFGFNCDDVISYIERSQKSFTEKQKELSEKVTSLAAELELSGENYKVLEAEKEQISKKLADFNDKYEEIERLSENIGKLYLVAQANAQAIMANSKKNAELSQSEVSKNLSTIDEAHKSLVELKKNIAKTSGEFMAELDGLIESLNETRIQVSQNTLSAERAKEQFDEVYKALVK